jgi:hypothetical protein
MTQALYAHMNKIKKKKDAGSVDSGGRPAAGVIMSGRAGA